METQFNFQIKPDGKRENWDNIKVHSRYLSDRVTAVHLAKKVARLFKAEVRLTEGNYPHKESGAYFHYTEK